MNVFNYLYQLPKQLNKTSLAFCVEEANFLLNQLGPAKETTYTLKLPSGLSFSFMSDNNAFVINKPSKLLIY